MKPKKLHIFILLVIAILSSCHHINNKIKLENGQIHIKNLTNSVFLTGKWYFIPNQFVNPQNFFKSDSAILTDKLVWNGNPFPKWGYGTYGCKIVVPAGTYALKIIRIQSAYKIYANGKKIYQAGKIAKKRKDEIPAIKPSIIPIISNSDTIKLIVQVSNYHFRIGGFQDKLMFGKYNNLQKETWATISIQFLILGFIFISVFFNLWLFFFRRKEISALYFALSILAQFIYELVNSEMGILYFLPNIPYTYFVRIDFSSNYLRFIFLILFIYEIFKSDLSKAFKYISYIGILFLLTVWIFPTYIFTELLIPSIIIVYLAMFWAIFVQTKRLIETKDGLYLFGFIGTLSIILIAIFETLYITNTITTFNFAYIGVILYVLTFTYLNARKIGRQQIYAVSLKNNILAIQKLKNEFLRVPAYDLHAIVNIIYKTLNASYIRICEYENKNILAHKGDESLFNEKIFNKALKNRKLIFLKNTKKKNSIIASTIQINNKNFIFYLAGPFKKRDLEVITLLDNQLKIFIDNYRFYKELKHIQENLEEIVQQRKQEALNQKNELIQKTIELDEKLEEIKINISVIQELNDQLLKDKETIEQRNKILLKQKDEIEKQRDKIFDINEQLGASLRYAKKINEALFKPYHKLNKQFFEFNLPKTQLGGDFWWTTKVNNKTILIIGDCVGYGVTGVFYTVLIQEFIKTTILKFQDIEFSASKILKNIYDLFATHLNKDFLYDTPLLTVITIDEYNNLEFSSFGQDALIIRYQETIELNAPTAIPGIDFPKPEELKNTSIKLKPNDKLYLFTDGFYKQLGKKGKYGKKRFKKFLSKIASLPLNSQKLILFEELDNWKLTLKQTDDILILGIVI